MVLRNSSSPAVMLRCCAGSVQYKIGPTQETCYIIDHADHTGPARQHKLLTGEHIK